MGGKGDAWAAVVINGFRRCLMQRIPGRLGTGAKDTDWGGGDEGLARVKKRGIAGAFRERGGGSSLDEVGF